MDRRVKPAPRAAPVRKRSRCFLVNPGAETRRSLMRPANRPYPGKRLRPANSPAVPKWRPSVLPALPVLPVRPGLKAVQWRQRYRANRCAARQALLGLKAVQWLQRYRANRCAAKRALLGLLGLKGGQWRQRYRANPCADRPALRTPRDRAQYLG
jgi:hypothetical protein